MRITAFDTETFRMGPGAIAPKVVTLTTAERVNGVLAGGIWGNGDVDFKERFSRLLDPGHILVAHNAAFDLAVISENFPDLEDKLWAKLDAGEITCTMIRQMLLNLSTHGHISELTLPSGASVRVGYSLDDMVLDRLGIDLSAMKESPDAPRMNYDLWDGNKAADYPPIFRQYALDDARFALEIYELQAKDVMTDHGHASLSTEAFRTAAHYALQKMTVRGLATDPAYYQKLIEMIEKKLAPERLRRLFRTGILRAAVPPLPWTKHTQKALIALGEDPEDESYDWSILTDEIRLILTENAKVKWKKPEPVKKDTGALKRVVERVARLNGLTLKQTDGGDTSTDKETIVDTAPFSRTLEQYQHWQSFQKLLTTDLPKLKWEGRIAPVVHSPFNPLVETGRTSSRASDKYPSFNGQQQGKLVRPCYKARDGMVISSVDYASLELVTTGQVTYDLFGYSEHRNRINAGVNLHSYLGAAKAHRYSAVFRQMCAEANAVTRDEQYALFMTLKNSPHKEERDFYEKWRNFAKPTGLGFPGGLGPLTMVAFAKANYGVNLMRVADEIGFQPEYDKRLMIYGKRLYKWKDESEFRWTKMMRAVALAMEMRDLWFELYPEMPEFFKAIKAMKDPMHEIIGRIEGRDVQGLCYTSPLGMHRAATSFTNTANGLAMQTPSAEGALTATITFSRACYDRNMRSPLYRTAFPLLFIHDEIVSEMLADEAHELTIEKSNIMVASMQMFTPDVKVGTEATLCERWSKRAKPVFVDGRLVPWFPKESEGETF